MQYNHNIRSVKHEEISCFTITICKYCSTVVSASASTSEIKKSGGIDLDRFQAEYTAFKAVNGGNVFKIEPAANLVQASDEHGGGEFWVEWGLDRHTSNYNHPTKVHRASASNNKSTVRSDWMDPTILVSAWIKSSLWGNKANWDVK